jgi:hypothetical protein
MSEQKHNPNRPVYADEISDRNDRENYESQVRKKRDKGLVAADAKDVGGWEAYRRWLTRVQAPTQRRAPLDPGLYTWKGYRNWSDKVRRDWSPDDQ